MTGINPKINSTQAGMIAKELDKRDGTEDGKISNSVWNEFVADKGGKTITQFITLENAMNSITTYLVRNAHKAGQSVKELADSWFNKEVEANKTAGSASVGNVEKSAPASSTERPKNTPPLKVTYPQVPPKGKDMRGYNIIEKGIAAGKEVLRNKEDGKTTAAFYRAHLNGKWLVGAVDAYSANFNKDNVSYFDKLNKDNAAYVVQNLGNLLFESKNGESMREKILNCLLAKAEELEIEIPQGDSKGKITKLADAIMEKNESAINEMNAMQSINNPNPELAMKEIVDKATGYEYQYDKNGRISFIEKNGAALFMTFDNRIWDNRSKPSCHFDKNGECTSTESDGNSGYDVSRNADGSVEWFSVDDVTYYVDKNTGEITRSREDYFEENGINMVFRDKDGNLKYYTEKSGDKEIYKNSNGVTLKSKDESEYYDANSKKISEEEWDKLEPTGT